MRRSVFCNDTGVATSARWSPWRGYRENGPEVAEDATHHFHEKVDTSTVAMQTQMKEDVTRTGSVYRKLGLVHQLNALDLIDAIYRCLVLGFSESLGRQVATR